MKPTVKAAIIFPNMYDAHTHVTMSDPACHNCESEQECKCASVRGKTKGGGKTCTRTQHKHTQTQTHAHNTNTRTQHSTRTQTQTNTYTHTQHTSQTRTQDWTCLIWGASSSWRHTRPHTAGPQPQLQDVQRRTAWRQNLRSTL